MLKEYGKISAARRYFHTSKNNQSETPQKSKFAPILYIKTNNEKGDYKQCTNY